MVSIKIGETLYTPEQAIQKLLGAVTELQTIYGNLQERLTKTEEAHKEDLDRVRKAVLDKWDVKPSAPGAPNPENPNPSPTTRKDFAIIKTVPTFGGTAEEKIEVFFNKLEVAGVIGNWGDNDLLLVGRQQLVGAALQYFMSDTACLAVSTLTDFKKILTERYQSKKTETFHRAQLSSIKMTKKVTVEEFGDRVKAVMAYTFSLGDDATENRIVIREADKLARDAYVDGLPDDVAKEVKLKEPENLDKAIRKAVFIVEIQRRYKNEAVPEKEIFAVATKFVGRCYNCGGQNHVAKDCFFDKPRCFNCGILGHISSDCRQPRQEKGERPGVHAASGSGGRGKFQRGRGYFRKRGGFRGRGAGQYGGNSTPRDQPADNATSAQDFKKGVPLATGQDSQ